MQTLTSQQPIPVHPFERDEVANHQLFTIASATDFNHHSGPDGLTGQFFSDDNAPETGISPS